MEFAPVDGVLRPFVPGVQPARLGLYVVAGASDQRPLTRRYADRIQVRRGQPEVEELTYRIGLQVDAHAKRAQFARRLVDGAVHADLLQCQGKRQPADPAACDDNMG